MFALLNRFDAADILVLASVEASFVEDARNQLQSHIAVDVMIEGLDQRLTDSIIAESCATPRRFLKRTIAKLPPTLRSVYFAAMSACDKRPSAARNSHPKKRCLSFSCSVFAFARRTRRIKLSIC